MDPERTQTLLNGSASSDESKKWFAELTEELIETIKRSNGVDGSDNKAEPEPEPEPEPEEGMGQSSDASLSDKLTPEVLETVKKLKRDFSYRLTPVSVLGCSVTASGQEGKLREEFKEFWEKRDGPNELFFVQLQLNHDDTEYGTQEFVLVLDDTDHEKLKKALEVYEGLEGAALPKMELWRGQRAVDKEKVADRDQELLWLIKVRSFVVAATVIALSMLGWNLVHGQDFTLKMVFLIASGTFLCCLCCVHACTKTSRKQSEKASDDAGSGKKEDVNRCNWEVDSQDMSGLAGLGFAMGCTRRRHYTISCYRHPKDLFEFKRKDIHGNSRDLEMGETDADAELDWPLQIAGLKEDSERVALPHNRLSSKIDSGEVTLTWAHKDERLTVDNWTTEVADQLRKSISEGHPLQMKFMDYRTAGCCGSWNRCTCRGGRCKAVTVPAFTLWFSWMMPLVCMAAYAWMGSGLVDYACPAQILYCADNDCSVEGGWTVLRTQCEQEQSLACTSPSLNLDTSCANLVQYSTNDTFRNVSTTAGGITLHEQSSFGKVLVPYILPAASSSIITLLVVWLSMAVGEGWRYTTDHDSPQTGLLLLKKRIGMVMFITKLSGFALVAILLVLLLVGPWVMTTTRGWNRWLAALSSLVIGSLHGYAFFFGLGLRRAKLPCASKVECLPDVIDKLLRDKDMAQEQKIKKVTAKIENFSDHPELFTTVSKSVKKLYQWGKHSDGKPKKEYLRDGNLEYHNRPVRKEEADYATFGMTTLAVLARGCPGDKDSLDMLKEAIEACEGELLLPCGVGEAEMKNAETIWGSLYAVLTAGFTQINVFFGLQSRMFEIDSCGYLPIHWAARYNPNKAVRHLGTFQVVQRIGNAVRKVSNPIQIHSSVMAVGNIAAKVGLSTVHHHNVWILCHSHIY